MMVKGMGIKPLRIYSFGTRSFDFAVWDLAVTAAAGGGGEFFFGDGFTHGNLVKEMGTKKVIS
jgi:hypothetical protein